MARSAAKIARYALYLFREFRWPLLVLTLLILGGGLQLALSLRLPYNKACWVVFMLMMAQPPIDFPAHWYNQVLFFAVPLIALGAIADSVVRLGYLIFSSKRKLQEWWIMEASLQRNHIVLCGLGKVGVRIAHELLALKEPFVAIERDAQGEFVQEVLDENIPVIFGDSRHRATLEKANVASARAIILATDDDLANIDAALTAREIRPDIRVVMRLFDDTLARKFAAAFHLTAISTAQVAAPTFAAAARGKSVRHAIPLNRQLVHVVDVRAERLVGRKIAELQREFDVSIALHENAVSTAYRPGEDRVLEPGDTLVVLGSLEKIRQMEDANRA